MRTGASLKTLLIVFATTAITACGGGGDNGPDNTSTPPPPFAMTVEAASTVEDHSVLDVTISTTGGVGAETIRASITRASSSDDDEDTGSDVLNVGATSSGENDEDGGSGSYMNITYEPTDTGYAFHFGEAGFTREEYVITVVGSKGSEEKEASFNVTLVNATGDTWRERALHINRVAPAQRMFIAEMVMIERLAQAVRLTGNDIDTKDLIPMYIDAMHKDEDILNRLYGAFTFPTRIERYMDGDISWHNAFGSLQKALSKDECEPQFCTNDYLVNIVPLFEYVIDQSQGAIARPSHGEVKFDNRTNTYSIFYVDGENGSFDESGNWSFKPELAYLSDLIIAGNDAAYTFTEKAEQPDDTDEDA